MYVFIQNSLKIHDVIIDYKWKCSKKNFTNNLPKNLHTANFYFQSSFIYVINTVLFFTYLKQHKAYLNFLK